MDLSLIIVNYHNSATLEACFQSILDTVHAIRYEVIAIDNSCGDPGWPELKSRFPQFQMIDNPENVGFAKANNQGARLARGETLLFLNPDIELHPHAVETLFQFVNANDSAGAVGPKVLNTDSTLQYSCRRFPTVWSGLFNRYSLMTRLFPNNSFSRHYLMLDFDHESLREVDWVSGCCLMVRRRVFQEVGQFDENYFLFIEDTDLCRMLKSIGHTTFYLPSATVTHHISSSNHRVPAKVIVRRHMGMSYYYRKYHSSNALVRGTLNLLIGLRCLLQLVLNVFR